jgi:hypothetical protein
VTVDRTTDTAGAGSPAPAVSSLPPDAGVGGPGAARPASADVVAAEARVELDRIRRRWAELPLEQAQARMPLLRRLLADLASRSSPLTAEPAPRWPTSPAPAEGECSQSVPVPDLGPAVVVDQLAVLVWDAYAAGRGDGIPERLVAARRALV